MMYADVIGDPVAHSKSPFIHNFWLKELGMAGDYRAHHVKAPELESYLLARRDDADWRGCNITIPHKETAYRLIVRQGLGVLGQGEADFGAINTVVRNPQTGELTGHNTDVEGVTGPLKRHALPSGAMEIAIIGAGGAARAALWGLHHPGSGHRFRILVRRPEQGVALFDAMEIKGKVLPIDGTSLEGVQLLINASPLGMAGKPPFGLKLDAMDPTGVVFDMIYAPLETILLAQARALGLGAIDGLQMLVGQAARAFQLFFGQEVPRHLVEAVHERLRAS